MAAKSLVSEGIDPNVLVSGDIIGFQIDTLGLLCTPSDHEPIPEKEEQISHLRISTTHKKASTADYRRCMFKIENDSGERSDIVFGSTIKISHHPTGLIVVASTSEDDGYKDSTSKLKCVFLSTSENIPSDSLVHKWIIAPRYKLREEGDPVRHNDYIILRNAQHKQLFLTSFPIKRKPGFLAPSSFTFTDHMVGLDSAAAVSSKPGLNILLLRKVAHKAEVEGGGESKSSSNKGKSKAAEGDDASSSASSAVHSSDYIRVMHREYRGHLIVRTDDELELQSSVMPLGSTNRKRANPALDHHLGVFLRTFADQQPREQLDFPAAYSSQGVWQVLSAEATPDSVAVHGKVKFGSAVRLRHLITGQYLSVRPLVTADTVKLKQFSSFCIPKQVAHFEAQEGLEEATPNRDRSRNVTSPAPATSTAPAPAKGSTPATSTAEKALPPTPPVVPMLHLCAASVHAVELHSTDWTGKHRNSVHLTFSSGPGSWDFKSQRSAASGNFCSWDLDTTDPAAHFSVTEQQVRSERMKAIVYREHVVSGRTIIGEGTVHLHSHIFQFERDETLDLSIPLTDPATGMPGGSINLLLVVNPLLSKEESRLLAHNSKGSHHQPGLLGGLMGTLGVTAPGLKRSGASDATSDTNSTVGSEEGDSANDDENNKDHDLGDLMEGAVGLSAAEIATTNWVVATSAAPDKYTKFNVLVVDRKASVDDESVSYNERFVFEHAYTKQRLKLSNLLGMEGQSTWWEYKGDTPLVPDPFREGSIVDSEVCQFDRVDEAEIKDILFGSRFLQLARAATTALQLTPRSSQLYMPLFRHFHNSLLSLTLWTLGVANSDSTLCAESTCNVDTKKHVKDSAAMRALAENMGTATEKLLAAGTERLAHGVQDGLALLGIDAELAGSADVDSYEDSGSSSDDDLGDQDTDSEEGDDEVDGGWNNSVGLQMGLLSPGSKYQAVSAKEDPAGRGKSKAARKKEEAAAASATAAAAAAVVPERQSSLAPWVGRKLPRAATSKGQKSSAQPVRDLPETPLLKYASSKLDEFMFKDLPVNEVLLRRQIILSDSMIVDQIVHFLNILFQLQRAVTLTHDERMQEQFPEVPPFLLACSAQINNVIRACVYKNEKVALKLISVQGSFLAMISQKIQGWDPPIEAILRQTCKDDDRETSYGCIDSMNSQNDSLAGSSMNKAVGGDVREAADSSADGAEDGGAGEVFNALAQEMFSIEPILMDAISASDVRQVVEQMHELHLQQDPSALKIISLLTLLCSSGRAKKYFQNLLINAIAIQDHEEYSLSGDFVQQLRPSSLQTNCMLFFTQFDRDQWQVKFNSPFSFPSQQSKNQEYLRDKLDKEGNSLKKLFAHYNTDDNAVLDVQECFELLEDLGLGGPFLYKEIRFLESSTIWGFACWWCYRSSFYYPASSISQCQLSPIQAIQVMGEKMTPALMELEMRRTMVSEQAVSQALEYMEILNKRIPGLCLQYEEKSEREVDGLSIVEDYVRSLGMTADAADDDDEFGFIPVINSKGAAGNRGSTGNGAGAGASAVASPGKRGMSGAGAWASARSAAQARRGFGTGTSGQTTPRSEWREFSAALEEGYSESTWFRLSLNLLAEICKDRNAYTQRIVGSILPAECLLAVLEADSVHYVEKSVLCKLLSNIYVDHRLVFPTRFSPFNTDIVYLGYKEDILNPAITMGKLFNAQSRTRFEGSGAEDGSELRRRLFLLLGQKISTVQLVSRSRAKIGYFASLFGLFKLLVLKGFFQEPEYGFVQSNKTPDDFVEGGSGPEAIKTEITLIDDKAFTMDSLQRMLVEKLNYVVLAQKCTVDFDEISAQDDIVANEKHDLLRGKLIEQKGRSFKTRRRFRKKTKNEEGADVSRDAAAKRSKARKTFDKVRDNFAFFDVLFADRTMADVVRSVIDILTYIHDIQQMLRLAKCWNYVTNAKLAMTERAYCQDTLNLDAYVPRLQLEGYLSKVFDGFHCSEPVPRYVDAVFSTTLYNNHDLRRKAFELLDRQLSLVRDGQHMFDHLTLVAKGHKAFLYRLSTVYEDQLMGYVAQIVSQPDPTNAYLLERLTFSVENLRALHFSTFLDRLDAVQSEEARRAQLRRTANVLKKEAAKLSIDARSFVPDGKPEQDCLTYLMKPIPCPTGIDDFFELDLERAIMQEGGVEEICAHFELHHQQVEISLPEAVINCDITMARLGTALINVMLQVTRAPLFFPWHALYESEKFLLDQLLSCLAEVGYNSQTLIDDWYPQISELLLTYFPESIGCGKMVISILRRCRAAHVGKDTFSKQILRTIVHHGLVGTSMCSSVLTSILQSDETVAVNFAASFLLSRIQEFTCTFNFFTQPEVMQSNDNLRHHLHSILLPLSMCFSGKMEIPESILAVLRVPLSRDFCYSYLNSNVVPMFLKTSLIKIAVWLYPAQLVPVETLVLTEIRLMRKAFSLDVNIDLEKCMGYCRDFLFQGVALALRKRIVDSRFLTLTEINAEVTTLITDIESNHIHNISVAKIVGAKLKEYFTVAAPPSPSKSGRGPTLTPEPAAAAPQQEHDSDEEDGFVGSSGAGTSLMDLSVFQCVMVTLNVLRLKHGFMSKMLTAPQRADLIFLCCASRMIMSRFPERIVNPLVGEGLRTADFEHMIERLGEITHGMIKEYLARAVEKHIGSYYETKLVAAARKQFKECSQGSAEKAAQQAVSVFDLQRCFTDHALAEEKARFQGSMKLAVVFPVEYLIRTPFYRFLRDCLESAAAFMDLGGDLLFGDWRTPVVKSKTFANKFSHCTDFELWLRGDGRYLQCLLQYLSRVKSPTDAEYNLLHLLTALLLHNIEEIRQSKVLSLNYRLVLVETETQRLRRLQLALNSLGAQSLLTVVLGNIYSCTLEPYIWLYAPLVLTFVNEVISWGNRESQQSIMDCIAYNIQKHKPPEMNCLLGLRMMVRKCNLEIAYCSPEGDPSAAGDSGPARLKGGYPDSEHTKILRSVKQLFTFVGMFCKGDNVFAQRFFSAHMSSSKQYVDLVLELCLLTNSILTKFTSMIVYMKNEAFYERLGPLVWESKDATKRRYLAWHSASNNILLFTQYMSTIIPMLDGLLSMCCEETAGAVQQALNKCPEVLEFAGLMQLDAVSKIQTRTVAGLSTGKHVVHWQGGNPFHFYRTYAASLNAAELAEGDPENEMIVTTLKRWSELKKPTYLGGSSFNMCDFLRIFGVSHEFFEETARRMEEKCLAMVLAYFEVAESHQSYEMALHFHDGLLMQNMNCTFQKIFSGGISANDRFASSAVAYTSLVETIGDYFPETQELLDEWEEQSLQQGKDPKKIYGVVEVVGKHNRLQRLYFPVPTFVSRFWPYPEVQKMKDMIVLQVNRQSPEEKLADFLQQMVRITTVMKRQERLRGWLTFPVHAFFGGKTTSSFDYLPNQRMLALLLTLALNIYYCYFTSLGDRFNPHDGSYVNRWTNWDFQDRALMIIKAVHLGLNASQTLSRLLNSEVTDELFQSYRSDSATMDVLLKLAVSPLVVFYLIQDTFWPLCMLAFSFLAFYDNKFWLYVPCLFDVAFQLTFMNFLYSAVALNGSKIWYTLVLAFLCLYFYSVIATLYFNDQYTLDSHSGCSNIVACFKLHLDYGLYNVPSWDNDGYISPTLPLFFVYGTLVSRVLGTMYNVSYVILINLVLQSIISGLIIDTFSKLREENESVLQDINDKCFICSISRDELEQAGIPFKQHILEEHNMWHYVWFKIYLESKDPLTYSSSENHSAENMKDTQSFLKLMPIKKSVSLNQKGEQLEADEKLEDKLDSLLLSMQRLSSTQNKLGKSVTLLRRANARIEQKVNAKQIQSPSATIASPPAV